MSTLPRHGNLRAMDPWSKPSLISIPSVSSDLGSLGVIEGDGVFPFPIKRVYFLFDVPADVTRGSHAHKKLRQLIVPVAGSFTVRLDDGNTQQDFLLDDASRGLTVPPGYWRTLFGFSQGSAALVLASEEYDESDYIRDYSDFLEWTRQ